MLKSRLIGVVALSLLTGVAAAQTKMDCSRLYKDFWEKFDREKYASDEQDAKDLFERLNRMQF